MWLSHAVLVKKWKALGPKIGERVGIKRLPDGSGPNGRYADYVVHVDRPADECVPDFEAAEGLDRATVGEPKSNDDQDIPF